VKPPYQETVEAVLAELGSDPQRGLTTHEAEARLRWFGPNTLVSAPPTPAWRRFAAQFQNPLVALMLVATLLSAGIWLIERASELPLEAITILAILLLNAALGFIQEARAEQAVAALKRMTAPTATVMRDGRRHRVLASEVVPGDILLIEEGDAIAADGRVIEAIGLQVSEAALTGESLPITKHTAPLDEVASLGDRRNMVFAGTVVTYGRGRAVVTATGMHTEVGQIADLLQRAEETATPLQAEITRVSRALGAIVIALAVLIIATILLTHSEITVQTIAEALVIGVSLAVAAVPEGLAAILTIVLALGMQRMAQRNVIVRRLAAVETLGSATVICTDKTGTLTRNEMTVRCLVTTNGQVTFTGSGYAPHGQVLGPDERPLGMVRCAPRSRWPFRRQFWPKTASFRIAPAAGQSRATPPKARCASQRPNSACRRRRTHRASASCPSRPSASECPRCTPTRITPIACWSSSRARPTCCSPCAALNSAATQSAHYLSRAANRFWP